MHHCKWITAKHATNCVLKSQPPFGKVAVGLIIKIASVALVTPASGIHQAKQEQKHGQRVDPVDSEPEAEASGALVLVRWVINYPSHPDMAVVRLWLELVEHLIKLKYLYLLYYVPDSRADACILPESSFTLQTLSTSFDDEVAHKHAGTEVVQGILEVPLHIFAETDQTLFDPPCEPQHAEGTDHRKPIGQGPNEPPEEEVSVKDINAKTQDLPAQEHQHRIGLHERCMVVVYQDIVTQQRIVQLDAQQI